MLGMQAKRQGNRVYIMSRERYTITVTCRRGDQPAYAYVAYDSVRPGRVESLVTDTAEGILSRETRSGFEGYLTTYGRGAIVVVGGRDACRFVVRARRS